MHGLDIIIRKNAEQAGREHIAALRADLEVTAKAIEQAQDEEIDRAVAQDGVGLISDSPKADLAFLGFNAGRAAARQEGN